MNALRTFRVYRELWLVLATMILTLAGWHNWADEVHALTTDPADDETVYSPDEEIIDKPAVESAAALEIDSEPTVSARTPELAPDKERILLMGDSMVEVLSPHFANYALDNGHELVPAIWYGSTTTAWAKSAELGQLIREINPTMVIVVLGSSELTRKSIDSRKPFIEKLIHRIGPRKVVWVGPPNWRPDTGINDLVESVVGNDRFFRSQSLTLSRKKDGIHPDAEGGRIWMGALAEWLAGDSRYAIRMAEPTRVARPVPARVLGRM